MKKKKEEDFSFSRKSEREAMKIGFKDAFLLANGKTSINEFVPATLEGFTDSELNEFKAPFERAKAAKMKLVIQSDFDADGITSAALFQTAMEPHFEEIVLLQNSKLTDGYNPIVKKIIKEGGENTFLVFLDSGIAMPKDDVDVLKANFTEICIIDHHEPQAYVPEVNILDMKLTRDVGFRDLCTAGMVYTIAHQLFDGEMDDILAPVAALGTIADMVPLIGDNAHIALKGYRRIHAFEKELMGNKKAPKYLGYEFINYTVPSKIKSGLNRKVVKSPISYTDMGFNLAPALNSTSRMVGNARIGVDALLGDMYSIKQAFELNEKRKELTKEAQENVEIVENDYIRIGFLDKKYKTINGLLANKLYENDKVVIVFAEKEDGSFTGSMRSPNKGKSCMDLIVKLKAISDKFNGGGHQPAAGLNVSDMGKDELVDAIFTEAVIYDGIEPEEKHIFEVEFTDRDMAFLFSSFVHIPFGQGVENPLLKIDTTEVAKNYYRVKEIWQQAQDLLDGPYIVQWGDLCNEDRQELIDLNIKVSPKGWVVGGMPQLQNIKVLMEENDFLEFLNDGEATISPSYWQGELSFNLQRH